MNLRIRLPSPHYFEFLAKDLHNSIESAMHASHCKILPTALALSYRELAPDMPIFTCFY